MSSEVKVGFLVQVLQKQNSSKIQCHMDKCEVSRIESVYGEKHQMNLAWASFRSSQIKVKQSKSNNKKMFSHQNTVSFVMLSNLA